MGEETEGMAESTSKLRDELKALTGVDIMKSDGKTFKSTYQIFDEISKVFDKLSDISQANVLEKLAGKTRSSVVAGLLKNFDTARAVVEDAQNAEGSALQENQKYMQSIEGHTDLLKNKWQEVWANSLNREAINFFLDLTRGVLDLVDAIGAIPTAIGTLSFFGLAKGGGRGKMLPLILILPKYKYATEAFNGNMYELYYIARTLIVKGVKLVRNNCEKNTHTRTYDSQLYYLQRSLGLKIYI